MTAADDDGADRSSKIRHPEQMSEIMLAADGNTAAGSQSRAAGTVPFTISRSRGPLTIKLERQPAAVCGGKLWWLIDDTYKCTYTELSMPCAANAVCDWPTGLEACKAFVDGGPPQASLRCARRAQLAGAKDGEDNTGEGEPTNEEDVVREQQPADIKL